MKNCFTFIIIVFLVSSAFAADRLVLLEDFTNCSCSYCWNFEPSLNKFISVHSDQIAVVRTHVSWPNPSDPIYSANPNEQNYRKLLYGVGGIPWVQIDGVLHSSSSYSGMSSAYNSRMAAPCHLEIQVENLVSDGAGTIRIILIAEEELIDEDLRAHAILVENGVPGTGYFAGTTFEQAFREELFGSVGQMFSFGSSYPDTVILDVNYDTGSWDFNNLQLAVFVQNHGTSGDEVHNAWFDYLGAVTSIEPGSEGQDSDEPIIQICPNPSSGSVYVTPVGLEGGTGVLTIYDTSGRCVANRTVLEDAACCFEISESGVYFAKVTSGGRMATSRIVVVSN